MFVGKLGPQFTVSGLNVHAVQEIVCRRATESGFAAEVVHSDDAATDVRAVYQAPWYRILLHSPPQRLHWEILDSPTQEGLVIRFDRQFFQWYRAVLGAVMAVAGWLWIMGFSEFFLMLDDFSRLSAGVLATGMAGIALSFLLARMVFTASGQIELDLTENIRQDVRRQGASLDQSRKPRLERKTLVALGFLVYLAIVNIVMVWRSGLGFSEITENWTLRKAAVLGVVTLSLLAIAAAVRAGLTSVRRRGADDRFAPVAPAMFTMLTVGCGLVMHLPFRLVGATNGDFWQQTFVVREALATQEGPIIRGDGGTAPRSRLEYGFERMRAFGGVLALMALAPAMIGIGALCKSVIAACSVRRVTHRLQQDTHTVSGRAAISGQDFLRSFKRTFGTIWIAYMIAAALGFVALAEAAVNGLVHSGDIADPTEPIGVVRGTTFVAAMAFGISPDQVIVKWGSQAFWLAWLVMACALPVIAVRGFARRRRRLRVFMERDVGNISMDDSSSLRGRISSDLGRAAGTRPPRIVVVDDSRLYASAYSLGLRQRQCVIAFSRPMVALLEPDELEALLAHEFSHYLCGHCIRHDCLRLLGQLTLVGGAFVGALQNSFGYEIEADRTAVEHLGASSEALARCLRKIHAATILNQTPYSEQVADSGLAAAPNDEIWQSAGKSIRGTGIATGIREGVRAWLSFFDSDSTVAYWHPATEERIRLLGGSIDPSSNEAGA